MRSMEWFAEVLVKLGTLEPENNIIVEGTSTELIRLRAFLDTNLRQEKTFRLYKITRRENILIIYKLKPVEPRSRLLKRWDKEIT